MMSQQRILVVDDDKEIVRVVRSYLEQAGYDVLTAYDGGTALHMLTREHPDLLVLDLMLPDRDGLDITRMVRGDPALARTYIIMLTARVDDTDKVVGLELGADDYVTKPFNPREIVARVRSAFRRNQLAEDLPQHKIYRYEGLLVDLARRFVSVDECPVELTPTEFNLLAVLIRSPGVPFSRAELVQKRLGYDFDSLERTLDSHVRNLRKKIEPDPANPTYVQTVYGVGYRLGEP
jgi:two-component system alkaline phosphatase synthesis response regulator PhoP